MLTDVGKQIQSLRKKPLLLRFINEKSRINGNYNFETNRITMNMFNLTKNFKEGYDSQDKAILNLQEAFIHEFVHYVTLASIDDKDIQNSTAFKNIIKLKLLARNKMNIIKQK